MFVLICVCMFLPLCGGVLRRAYAHVFAYELKVPMRMSVSVSACVFECEEVKRCYSVANYTSASKCKLVLYTKT